MAKLDICDRTYAAYYGTEGACDRKKFVVGFEKVFASGKHLRDCRHKSKRLAPNGGI